MMIIKAHHKCIYFMAALSASLIYIYIFFLFLLTKVEDFECRGIVMQEARHANPLWKHIYGGFYHMESIIHEC